MRRALLPTGCPPARAAFVAPLAAALLGGCFSYGPEAMLVGQTVREARSRLGPPTLELSMPRDGVRMVYARGPFGRHTYMVDVDRDGIVTGWNQVLDERHFRQLPLGAAPEEILRQYGPPADRRRIGLKGEEVWSYRYQTFDCRWFQVTFDRDGRTTGGSYGPDPLCDTRDDMGQR